MSMKRFLLSVLMVVVAVYAADAQNNTEKEEVNSCNAGHYFVFDVGGGLHTLAYNVDGFGKKKPGAGIMVRGGYRYFFTENWGVGTELNFKSFQSTFIADYTQKISDAIDEDNYTYQHRTYYNDLKEKQSQMVLSLPIAIYFQQRLNQKWKLGGGLGAVAQFEIVNKYNTSDGDLETRGYYDIFNVELYGMDQHNFFTKSDFDGKNKKRSSIGLLVEGNALYYITKRLSIDLGIYFTVGMGYKSEGDDLNQFDPDCMKRDGYQWKYNGALDSKVVDIPTPIAVGGMAGIRYQFGKIKPKTVPEKPIDKPVDVPDTNIVVDVPVKDTIPNVVVVEDIPEKDTVPVVVDVPKQDTVPTVVVTEPEKPKEDVTVVVKKFTRVNVTFGFNESYIKSRPDLARMLDEISEVMNEYPETKLSVTGHTCNIGSLDQNMRLGQKRAEAFKAELVKRGVNSDRISCDSKAYLEPLFPNTTEANREKNRRVEFTLTEK